LESRRRVTMLWEWGQIHFSDDDGSTGVPLTQEK